MPGDLHLDAIPTYPPAFLSRGMVENGPQPGLAHVLQQEESSFLAVIADDEYIYGGNQQHEIIVRAFVAWWKVP
jgi:hypothetical protein